MSVRRAKHSSGRTMPVLLEWLGETVDIVNGDYYNIKLTTPEDLVFGEAIYIKGGRSMRIGQGFDVHAFEEGRPLIFGGIEIPHERGLLGHSDADVLLHTIADAALGAIAAETSENIFQTRTLRSRTRIQKHCYDMSGHS